MLSPAKGRWLAKENEKWHKELKTDIAMLLKDGKEQTDLVEVFCSPTSTLTKTAQSHGLKAERWTKEDFDLSRPSGCQLAMERLRQLRPKRLWLSPECGPYSIMQNANQISPQQAENLRKRENLPFDNGKAVLGLHGYR